MKASTCRTVSALLAMLAGSAGAQPAISALETPQSSGPEQRFSPEVRAEMLDRAQRKFAHAMQVTHQFDESARINALPDESWRSAMLGNLMAVEETDFDDVLGARDVSDAMQRSARTRRGREAVGPVAKSLGSTTYDLVYEPITPCRILDTRLGSGASGTFAAKETRNFSMYASLNTGSGACGVSGQIVAFSQNGAAFAGNVTVDETGLSGFADGAFLKIYPQNGSSTTSFISYGPGQIVANAGVISVEQASASFTVCASKPANVIIDNFGLFMYPQATALDCVTVTGAAQPVVASGVADANAACGTGYSLTGGACGSDSYSLRIVSSSASNGSYYCTWANEDTGTAHNGTPRAQCCRTPGR
jgi:hypothetical protein